MSGNQDRQKNKNKSQGSRNKNNKGGYRHNKRGRHHKGNRPKNADTLVSKYLNLLDQHLSARKKYFEMYYRADPNQKVKLEKNFYKTVEQLREFEAKIPQDLKEKFILKTDQYGPDNDYSTGHNIPKEGALEIESNEEIQDPHYLNSQMEASYKDDREESSGAMEEYLNYKSKV